MNEHLDRFHVLLDQDQVTGIDFVCVEKDQTTLKVYFLQSEKLKPKDLLASIVPEDISIRSFNQENISEILVKNREWKIIDGRDVLQITTFFPGDFKLYRLNINSNKIDVYYNDIIFSFKVNCSDILDCKEGVYECSPEREIDYPIDYMARDFYSFRKALLDFASLRYPDWKERLEADTGIMLAEVMSALGDEMAYYQDRISREAYLETATQRRSVQRHARLIDYLTDEGQAASTWLDYTITSKDENLPAGSKVWAINDTGEKIYFHVGLGLEDKLKNTIYPVSNELNVLYPYIYDENDMCLPVGCTDLYLEGDHKKALEGTGGLELDENNGKWVLIQTNPEDASIPPKRHMVRLIKAETGKDILTGKDVTHVAWASSESLSTEICMKDIYHPEIHGNMIPAVAGEIKEEVYFITGSEPDPLVVSLIPTGKIERAIEREGPDGAIIYLFSIPNSDEDLLAWSLNEKNELLPQIYLTEMMVSGNKLITKPNSIWDCKRSLLIPCPSGADDLHYTLDNGFWKRVVGYWRNGREIVHKDYFSNNGTTIRFGDGEFGYTPPDGTIFKTTYSLGGGARGNVPADSIKYHENAGSMTFVSSIRNPFAVINGRDPESMSNIKTQAPYRFKSASEFAVRPSDYGKAVERMTTVQKAGASFRWTGSWLSVFVTPDPKGSVELSKELRQKVICQLERFRQAGREVHVLDPSYADLDIVIKICVEVNYFKDEVKLKIIEKLLGKKGVRPEKGFFSADHFTFGTLLDRSVLEAEIQSVPGVKAVIEIRYKRRGFFKEIIFNESVYDPGIASIIRVENDLLHPERGTLKLEMEGGV